jgi:type I restriction enzyme, S subunit
MTAFQHVSTEVSAMQGLQPYPAYKDSGVPWLGAVPVHWGMQSLGSLTKVVNDRGRPDLQLLSVLREKGVVVRSELREDENRNYVPDDLGNYKVVRTGNLVINKMKAWQGSLGIAPADGIVSPAYFVFDFRVAHKKFGHRLLRSKPYVAFYNQVSDGVRIGQWDLSIQGMKRIPVLVPPVEEQEAIGRFLDHIDRRINRYIRAKRRLIALLNEQKQAIIHRAVTRGLDPDVPLKPSGVEWLGEIPAHWEARAFVRCVVERADYRGATPTKTESGAFLVTARNIRQGWIDYEVSKEYVSEDQYEYIMRRGLPKCNDLLLTTEAPLGNVALIDREDIALAQRVIRFRLDESVLLPQFAMYSMSSRYFQDQLLCRATGSTALGIKASKLPQLQIVLPPVDEQRHLLTKIADETATLTEAMKRTGEEIDLIREYRTRLIADVVTGKLDVRGVALPEDGGAGEAELFDEVLAEEGFDEEGEEDDAWEEAEDGDD